MTTKQMLSLTLLLALGILSACAPTEPQVAQLSTTAISSIDKPVNPFFTGLSQAELNSMKEEAWRIYGTHWKGVSIRSRYVRQPLLETLNKYGFPRDLQMVPVVESSYDPYAQSSVGATGLWQLMPGTAKDLGIKNSKEFDGRRDIRASTKAAAKFLTTQYQHFGNWPMALAAYHLGPNAVEKRLKRRPWNPEMGLKKAMLPPITKTYIRHIIGLIALQEEGRISFPAPYPTSTIKLATPIDLATLHRKSGLPTNQIFKFNPQLALGQYYDQKQRLLYLRIPNSRVRTVKAHSPKRHHTYIEVTVRAGETLLDIQKHYKISRYHLRKINPHLINRVTAGQTLRIPLQAMNRVQPEKNPLVKPAMRLLASN